jgi:hypothetical protein
VKAAGRVLKLRQYWLSLPSCSRSNSTCGSQENDVYVGVKELSKQMEASQE